MLTRGDSHLWLVCGGRNLPEEQRGVKYSNGILLREEILFSNRYTLNKASDIILFLKKQETHTMVPILTVHLKPIFLFYLLLISPFEFLELCQLFLPALN